MGPNNSSQNMPSSTQPLSGPESVPPQAGVQAEIVENIPVKQPTAGNAVISDQPQAAGLPKPEDKKTSTLPEASQKTPNMPKPPKSQAKPRPLLAIFVASLVAVGLSVAAYFAFSGT